jgi:hypothetical protein
MMNMLNDMRRDIMYEAMYRLDSVNLLTNDVKTELTNMISSTSPMKTAKVVTKKDVLRKKTPRFSGYHIFMKEHRVVVKGEQPGIKPQQLTTIVAKAWKHVPEVEKKTLNDRALKMKEAYHNTSDRSFDEPKKAIEEPPKKAIEEVNKKQKIRISNEDNVSESESESESEHEDEENEEKDITDLASESESDEDE